MLFRVTYIDSETDDDGNFVTKLGGRDENGERRVVTVKDHDPYIFAPADEPVPADDRVVGTEGGYESFDGVPLRRIDLSHKNHARRPDKHDGSIRNDFSETYEADIPYYRRCALDGMIGHIEVPSYKTDVTMREIDLDPEVDEPIEPRICIGDIEVLPDYDVPFNVMKERAEQPIICATFWDSYTDVYTIIAIDPDHDIKTGTVKYHLDQHWPEEYKDYVSADFELTRVSDEERMATAIKDYFSNRRFDVVGGWNFVDFDWEYILRYIQDSRANMHRLADIGHVKDPEWASGDDEYPSTIERAVSGLPAFDMMEAFTEKMSRHNWRSKALDYVADEELEVGKVEGIDIADAYENDFSLLIAYNIIDVQLLVALERQNDIYQFFFELGDASSIPIYDTFSEIRLVDGYILSRRDDDEVLPVVEKKSLPKNAGGLVLEPYDGIAEWIGVLDVKSLYPSSIISWNISTETLEWKEDGHEPDITIPWVPEADEVTYPVTDDQISWDTFGTSLEEEGIIPKYLKELFKSRAEKKAKRNEYGYDDPEWDVWDRKQGAVKVIMNSFYGASANDFWRMSTEGLGDAITSASRYVLYKGKELVERNGYDVYYGDTDSVFVSLERENPPSKESEYLNKVVLDGKGLTNQLNDAMYEAMVDSGLEGDHPFLDGSLHGTSQHCLTFEFEKLYRRYLQQGKKKRYAGKVVWEEGDEVDDLDIKGFETKRSDSTELAAKGQKKVLNMLLSGESFEAISEYVRGHMETIETDFEPREHALPSVVNKDIEEYPNGPRKRGVGYSNEHLGYQWTAGTNPWLVYVKETPPDLPSTDIIAIDWMDDVPDGFTVDATKMQEKNLELPLRSIVNSAGYEWREVKSGKQAQTIVDDSEDGSRPNPFESSGPSQSDSEEHDLLSNW